MDFIFARTGAYKSPCLSNARVADETSWRLNSCYKTTSFHVGNTLDYFSLMQFFWLLIGLLTPLPRVPRSRKHRIVVIKETSNRRKEERKKEQELNHGESESFAETQHTSLNVLESDQFIWNCSPRKIRCTSSALWVPFVIIASTCLYHDKFAFDGE